MCCPIPGLFHCRVGRHTEDEPAAVRNVVAWRLATVALAALLLAGSRMVRQLFSAFNMDAFKEASDGLLFSTQ